MGGFKRVWDQTCGEGSSLTGPPLASWGGLNAIANLHFHNGTVEGHHLEALLT